MENKSKQLKFPCDCISSVVTCEEPWARVAKDGMFKDGARETILNKLNETPQTIAQLSKSINLAQPTVYKHVNELLRHKLIRKDEIASKNYVVERYYRLNFPVILKEDEKQFIKATDEIAKNIATLVKKKLPAMAKKYDKTATKQDGWNFEEFSQYLYHSIQRKARKQLENEGILQDKLKDADLDFILWANE